MFLQVHTSIFILFINPGMLLTDILITKHSTFQAILLLVFLVDQTQGYEQSLILLPSACNL